MFIKKTKNAAGQTYLHLVESYREGGRVKQRVLLSLGREDSNRVENLVDAIGRYRDVVTATQASKQVDVESTYIYGPFAILREIFERFHVAEALERVQKQHPKLGVDLSKLVFTLVASRFIAPLSKLGLFDGLLKELYPEMIYSDLQLHQIYRGLDVLAREKDEIEQLLFWGGKDLFATSVDVVLYDLTTLRFESTREDLGTLRRFGYSKEMRTDCTQVVLGLLVDTEGIPLGFEVYPGNKFEGQTIKDIVDKIRNKFQVRRFIFVGDRGIFSKENLNELRQENGEFIIGMRLGVFKQRHGEFYNIENFAPITDELKAFETTHEGDRCIITWSKKRAERDRKTREDILRKISRKLTKPKATAKAFVSNSNYHKFLTGLGSGETPTLNQKAIDDAAKKDGFFAVITNVKDMSASQIVVNYKNLWRIEDAFGELKGTLKARPIFHWTDQRIIGHLMVCFLTHYCEAQITRVLREKNRVLKSTSIKNGSIAERPLTVAQAMKELAQVRVIPVRFPNEKTLWVRTDIRDNAATLFQAIGVKIPPKVLNLNAAQV